MLLRWLVSYTKGTSFGRRRAIRIRIRNNTSRSYARKILKSFGLDYLSEEEQEKLYRDMSDCFRKYSLSYFEYLLYRLQDKSEEERSRFGSAIYRLRCYAKFNKARNNPFFEIKSLTAKKFAPFFKRETLVVDSLRDKSRFVDMLMRRKRVVVKPLTSLCGNGVQIVSASTVDEAESLASEIISSRCNGWRGGVIVEEVIEQDPRMAKLHPESVNTLRITTYRLNDRTVIFHPFIRAGRGASVVDNGGKGGILGLVDPQTGEVVVAADEKLNYFTEHPDTKEPLVGFKVPEYESARAFAKELAQVLPSNRIVGWDLALSTNGWVVVEANHAPSWFHQMLSNVGCRPEVEGYMQELGYSLDTVWEC